MIATGAELFLNGEKIGTCNYCDITMAGDIETGEILTKTVDVGAFIIPSFSVKCKMMAYDYCALYEICFGPLTFNEKLDIGIDHFFRNLKKLF
jgi:hypothetical protein